MNQVKQAMIWGALAVLLPGIGFAQGVTYRCVDENGRSTYTNVKEEVANKKCVVVSREVSVVPAPPPPPQAAPKPPAGSAAKGDARNQDARNQNARDGDRRKILQSELESEEKALAGARQKLAEQEAIRSGDERNYARVLERLKPFQEEVQRHEQNVAQLRREISNLR
jgi:septal ring factor EnvC (AmiA/AmiB activator)